MTTDEKIELEIKSKGKAKPRITLAEIEANISSEHYFTALQGCAGQELLDESDVVDVPDCLAYLTFCVLVLRNGVMVTGDSDCASPENLDSEIIRKVARANAIQKIWTLMGCQGVAQG